MNPNPATTPARHRNARVACALPMVSFFAAAAALAADAIPAPAPYAGVPFQDAVYNGGAQVIPGRLQNEYFDRMPGTDAEKTGGAGEGVTYHDSDGKNSGSGQGGLNGVGSYLKEFRMFESPDVSYVKFDNPGTPIDDSSYNLVAPDRDALYLGWIAPGEWVNYTVEVKTAGTYSLTVRYTSKLGGGFVLASDGVDLTGPLTLPISSNPADLIEWRKAHHWNQVTKFGRFSLKAGRQVLTLRFVDKPVINLDYLDFVLEE